MTNSRQKGKRGERELSRALNALGFDTRRGQQFSGANGDADVVGLPGIHIECKRTEHLRVREYMSQAISDASEGNAPTVFWKCNHGEWYVIQRLTDWAPIYREAMDDM